MVLDNILLKKIEEVKQFIANMIPIAGNQTPSADTTNGSSGTNMDYAKSDHTHPKSNLYAETNHTHSQYLTTHQDISGKLNISQTSYKGKNVVVDNTTGNITFEDKPTVPQASTSSPLADMTGGAIGSDSKYAKADHQHPLSSAYATSGHTHTTSDLPSDVINEGDIDNIIGTLNTNDIFAYSNKNVGQSGDTICLVGKLYGDDIEGKTIQFYNNNTLLGSSNTDVYGAALYDYVCTGDGKKEITTKYGTLVSQPTTVHDCIKYDKGNTANTIWTLGNNSNAQLDLVDNSYRKLSEITTGTDAWVYLKIDHSCVLEFDAQIVATNYATSFFQLGQSPNATTRIEKGFWDTLKDSNWHHIKLSISDGQYSITSPDSTQTVSNNIQDYDSSIDMYFRFRTLSNVTEINFKEFKYYSI